MRVIKPSLERTLYVNMTFNIPSSWPVLVLEETEDRISWFRQRLPQAIFARCAKDAVRELSQREFKELTETN
jgi:hypothetical protein